MGCGAAGAAAGFCAAGLGFAAGFLLTAGFDFFAAGFAFFFAAGLRAGLDFLTADFFFFAAGFLAAGFFAVLFFFAGLRFFALAICCLLVKFHAAPCAARMGDRRTSRRPEATAMPHRPRRAGRGSRCLP
jgi:hypothetical protein